jgi:divalent metal cation (Fe/Co/Zn/Cd) transporter
MIQPTPQPVPVYALHERLPHRPRPSVVRRVLRHVNVADAYLILGFIGAWGAVLVIGLSLFIGGLWLLGGLLGLAVSLLVFRRGVRLSPEPASEHVELGKLEWF